MKKETVIYVFTGLLFVFIAGCATGAFVYDKFADGQAGTETVRDTVTDTLRYDLPIIRDSAVIRYVRVVLPVVKDTNTQGNYAQNNGEIIPCGTLAVDSDSVGVVLPIAQKHYSDSTYDAWVSGYMPRLDSIMVYRRTITNTIYVKKLPSRWNAGLQGGYGITPKGLQPYIGIGVSYRIFPP